MVLLFIETYNIQPTKQMVMTLSSSYCSYATNNSNHHQARQRLNTIWTSGWFLRLLVLPACRGSTAEQKQGVFDCFVLFPFQLCNKAATFTVLYK